MQSLAIAIAWAREHGLSKTISIRRLWTRCFIQWPLRARSVAGKAAVSNSARAVRTIRARMNSRGSGRRSRRHGHSCSRSRMFHIRSSRRAGRDENAGMSCTTAAVGGGTISSDCPPIVGAQHRLRRRRRERLRLFYRLRVVGRDGEKHLALIIVGLIHESALGDHGKHE